MYDLSKSVVYKSLGLKETVHHERTLGVDSEISNPRQALLPWVAAY